MLPKVATISLKGLPHGEFALLGIVTAIQVILAGRVWTEFTVFAVRESTAKSVRCIGNVRRRGHGENTASSSQPIDILRSLLVSINIEAMMTESAIYREREMLSKMVDGLELGDDYGG